MKKEMDGSSANYLQWRATEVTMMVGMVFKMRKAIRHISGLRRFTQEMPLSVQHNSTWQFFKIVIHVHYSCWKNCVRAKIKALTSYLKRSGEHRQIFYTLVSNSIYCLMGKIL